MPSKALCEESHLFKASRRGLGMCQTVIGGFRVPHRSFAEIYSVNTLAFHTGRVLLYAILTLKIRVDQNCP